MPGCNNVGANDNWKTENKHEKMKIATWNVRTLYQAGKLQKVLEEAELLKFDALRINEVRWIASGHIQLQNRYDLIYSGGQRHKGETILKKNPSQ